MHRLEKIMGRKITGARTKAGLTTKALADALQIAETKMVAYESGRERVPPRYVVEISSILDVSLCSLFPEEDEIFGDPFSHSPISTGPTIH